MQDDSFEIVQSNIEQRSRESAEALRILSELLSDCEVLGDREVVDLPTRALRVVYRKYDLKVEATCVPSKGWWVMQSWKHPKNDGFGYADAFCMRFVPESDAANLRGIVLECASVVEEILSRDPVRWYHLPIQYWLFMVILGCLMFAIVVVCAIEVFR
jgi:hypothetical protein